MNNKDLIQRFLIENANVRGELVRLTTSYQTIIGQHPYPAPLQKLLGELLTISALLSAIIKFNGRLTVQFRGKDPLKLLLAQCNNAFELRALAQWQGELSEQDLLAALKEGTLAIIINPDNTTTRYQGIVAWEGDSLAHSIEGYFKNSEQLPTRLWLAVNETTAAGLLLQPLPGENTLKSKPIVGDDAWGHIETLTETLTPDELLNLDNQTILHRLYNQEEVRLFAPEPVSFKCTCSIERGENAVLMLGEEEAEQELKDKQKIVVTCEFCNKEYAFDRVDVANIFKKQNQAPNQLH
ncbi:MAG: Hsp33 family molecular chaperone HslO [Gammaproteobacteria bacterium]